MDEARKLDLRPLLAVAALVAVVVTMWAAGAFAAGGSTPSSDSPGSEPAPFIQTEDEQAPPREDCPKDRGGGGGDGAAHEGDTGGSGSPAL